MSRSNPNGEKPQTPCNRFFEWNGAEGYFYYYNKDTKENVKINLPFAFLVLDQLSTIKGWSDADKSGIWSNEVRFLDKQKLIIFTKGGKQAEGIYENVKGKVSGSKYTKCVYVAYYNDKKELEIGCILMNGASLSSWIEFTKENNVNKGAIRVDNYAEDKKGAVKFRVPIFTPFDCKPETNEKAIELDNILQAYLTEYFSYSESFNSNEPSQQDREVIKATGDNLEYAKPKRPEEPKLSNETVESVTQPDFDDLPF